MSVSRTLVTTDRTRFVADGKDFPVVGANCYFLAYCNEAARVDVLSKIKAIGANVVRTMAFLNFREPPPAGPWFQASNGGKIVMNEGMDGLGRLDRLLEAAEENDLRLILPLVNYWNDLGGMGTYLDWLFPDRHLRTEEFYGRPEARKALKNWIGTIVNRYRDSPAVLAWELANEPRCPIPGGRELLLDWAEDMARFVKSVDPNHLVALGDEGFFRHAHPQNHLYTGEYGVDFESILSIPEIDFGTYHFYPGRQHMNVPVEFGTVWIEDHIAAGERAAKPVVLEEYGLKIGEHGIASTADRDARYADWLATVHARAGAGDLLWMLGSDEPTVSGNRDDYTILDIAEIPSLAEHGRSMRARNASSS